MSTRWWPDDAEGWRTFCDECRDDYLSLPAAVRVTLDDLEIPEDIKVAAISNLRAGARDWLCNVVPTLAEQRPIDLIHAGRSIEVREALWTMPAR